MLGRRYLRSSPSLHRDRVRRGCVRHHCLQQPTVPLRGPITPPRASPAPRHPRRSRISNGPSAVVTSVRDHHGGIAPVVTSCHATKWFSVRHRFQQPSRCTATDAVQRSARCDFVVSVQLAAARLGVSDDSGVRVQITKASAVPGNSSSVRICRADKSYPADLAALLGQRYIRAGRGHAARCLLHE